MITKSSIKERKDQAMRFRDTFELIVWINNPGSLRSPKRKTKLTGKFLSHTIYYGS